MLQAAEFVDRVSVDPGRALTVDRAGSGQCPGRAVDRIGQCPGRVVDRVGSLTVDRVGSKTGSEMTSS